MDMFQTNREEDDDMHDSRDDYSETSSEDLQQQ